MFRANRVVRAPPKALWPARVHAPNFLGINWNKVTWQAPHNNMYPLSICAGVVSRAVSSPIWWGNKEHRMQLNTLRNCILILPSVLLGVLFFLQCDQYEILYMIHVLLDRPMPTDIEAARREEMRLASREKPGFTMKHKLGGQISIQGSDLNIIGD